MTKEQQEELLKALANKTKNASMEYKKVFKVSEITDIKPGPNSHKEILEMVSKRRPYRPSDFKKQFFIPDLDKVYG